MTFVIGDCIAHPMHGAGVIDSIETKKLGGVSRDYYVLRIVEGDILVKIPTDAPEAVGVRHIIRPEQADAILRNIETLEVEQTQNWNQRYRENMLKIRSGNLLEVATVVKSLSARHGDRGLSTAERKMLQSAKQILISELVLSKHLSYDEISAKLDNALL